MMIEGRANELPDFVVFKTVIKYCLYIIILPIVSFFVAKVILFDSLLQLGPVNSSIYSAVVAVVALHITLGLFIYKAYFEVEKAPPSKLVKED